jgi:hypothetical protein
MQSAAQDLIQLGIAQNDEIVGHANLLYRFRARRSSCSMNY